MRLWVRYTQIFTLLGRKSQFLEITRDVPFSRGSYLLYLVHSSVNYVYELGESSRLAQDRLRLLRNLLEG